jgi:YD repeat-containing protein
MQPRIDNIKGRRTWTINGRFVTQRVTGVQRYAFEIVRALNELLSQDPQVAARLALRLALPPGVESEPDLSEITICRTGFGSGHAWDQLVLPLYAGAEVLSFGNFGPLLAQNHIVCIHDANVFIQPESYSRTFGLAYRSVMPLVGKRARRVATVSQFSADMLVKYGVCRREQIFIAPNGHEHALRWNASRARTEIHNLKRPYVLLLGSTAKHKNIDVILQQAEKLEAAGINIIVAGGTFSIFSSSTIDLNRSNVHCVGYAGEDDLAALYERALCLAFPSRTEGFGLPPLEAMARGCPVVSSNVASLVEVGGDAALYAGPDDGDRWVETIVGLSQNESLRATMSDKGRSRAGLFSWRRSAQVYLDEIDRLLPR